MIYLIDDDLNNSISRFGFDFDDTSAPNYGKITQVKKLLLRPDNSDLSELNFLNDAHAIFLHDSFCDVSDNGEILTGSTTNVAKIKEKVAQYGQKIPLAVFSNGFDGVTYRPFRSPHYLMAIKKDMFYQRLQYFFEIYSKTNVVDLRFLAYTKEQIILQITELARELLRYLNDIEDDALLSDKDLFENTALHNFLKYSLISLDTHSYIRQHISGKMTKGDLLQHLRDTFKRLKYENNPVYHW
jgi:hypothetical protein